MSAALLAELGSVDPHQATDREQLCSARSDVAPGMVDAFRCTRRLGHVDRKLPEHVASAPHHCRLPVALAAWVTGGAPRIMDAAR